MERGIVLEVEGKTATVLTPDGRFLRVPVPREGWLPGEEVTWVRRPMGLLRPALALACVVLLLLLPGGLAYQHYWALGPVVAYVSVDINPSLELGIDARERVCVARGLNADGERLLAGLPYRRRALDRVLTDLTLRAIEEGYLSRESAGAVLVTVTPAPAGVSGSSRPGTRPGVEAGRPAPARSPSLDPVRVRDEAVAVATRLLKERGLRSLVKGLAAGPEVRDEADRLEISPGRLVLYLAARDAGIPVTIDQLRQGPVGQVMRQAWGDQVKKARTAGQEGEGRAAGQEGKSARSGGSETVPGGNTGPGSHPPAGRVVYGGDKAAPGRRVVPGTPELAAPPGKKGAGEKEGTGSRQGPVGSGLEAAPGAVSAPSLPWSELKEGEEETISSSEFLEKLWEKTRVEKELPALMKKFLPPGPPKKESGEKDRSGDR